MKTRSAICVLAAILTVLNVVGFAGVPPTYTSHSVDGGYFPASPVITNLDGDDYPDLVTLAGGCYSDGGSTYCNPQQIRVYWGTGAAVPPLGTTIDLPVTRVYPGDFDGDGLVDLLAAGSAGSNIYLVRNLGGRVFQIPTVISTASRDALFSGNTFDFNADFLPDILFWTSPGNYYPGLGTGGGNFTLVNSAIAAGLQTAVGDLNKDGRDDLVVVTKTTWRLYLSNGNGTFTTSYGAPYCQIHCDQGSTPHEVKIGDLNGDGTKDIALAMSSADQSGEQSNLIFIYSPATNGPTSWLPGDWDRNKAVQMFIGDLDGDGKDEVGFPNRFDTSSTMFLGSNSYGGAPVTLGRQSIFLGDTCEWRYSGGSTISLSGCRTRDIAVGGLQGQGQRGADIVEAWSLHYEDYACSDGDPMDGIPPECNDTYTNIDNLTIYRNPNARYLRMSLAASKNPSTPLEAVTLTATVTGNSTAPAGSVIFASGNVTLCNNVTLVAGKATCTTTFSAVGSHFVQAVFASSNTTYGNAKASYTHTTVKATPTVSVSTSKTPSALGESITFTATVTNGATGSFSFYRNGTYLGGSVISGTTASFTTSSLPAGTHSISATYSGDSVYESATAYVTQVVTSKANLTLTLSSNINPSTYGTAVTFTVAGLSTATGSVTFKVNGTAVGTGAIASGTASFTTTVGLLQPGSNSVVAEYAGNAFFNAATSPTLTQVVNKATPTITYSCTPTTITFGATITCTARVNTPVGAAFPSGTVDFIADGSVSNWGTFTLDGSGVAAATSWSTAAPGTHTAQARYNGDSRYNAASSAVVTLTINKAPVSITASSTRNPSIYGDTVTVTFTFAGVGGITPTGTATLTRDGVSVGTLTLDAAGKASYTTNALNAGNRQLSTVYNGDNNYR